MKNETRKQKSHGVTKDELKSLNNLMELDTGELIDSSDDQFNKFPDGVYLLRLWAIDINPRMKRAYLRFRIVKGSFKGKRIFGGYPVRLKGNKNDGGIRRWGKFYLIRPMKLAKELRACGINVPSGAEITLKFLEGTTFLCKVGLVTRDREKKPIPKARQYSVVREIRAIRRPGKGGASSRANEERPRKEPQPGELDYALRSNNLRHV